MIAKTDFSATTLKAYNAAKKSKSFCDAWDFIQILIQNDYSIVDVKLFAKKEFPNHYEFLNYDVL